VTAELAQSLAWVTILVTGALIAAVAVSLLPRHMRTRLVALSIATVSISTVAVGSDIAQSLPRRIIAQREAAAAFAGLRAQIPEIETLAEVDPIASHDLMAAFHEAWMAEESSQQMREARAGHKAGLAIQRAFWRNTSRISDESALRLIALERQVLESAASNAPAECRPSSAGHNGTRSAPSTQLAALRRKLLGAKVQALSSPADGLPKFSPAEQAAFQARLLASLDPHESRCGRIRQFYARLQEQPVTDQGKWVRSQTFFPLAG
jgi:hypothetical protein